MPGGRLVGSIVFSGLDWDGLLLFIVTGTRLIPLLSEKKLILNNHSFYIHVP